MDVENRPFPDGKTESDLRQCKIVQHLTRREHGGGHGVGGGGLATTGKLTECWDNAWSPDNQLLAWSSGQRIVNIIQAQKLHTNTWTDCVTVDCRQIVTALSFADCSNYHDNHTDDTHSYRMFQWQNHAMVLAVGLSNGKIRIYDTSNGKILIDLIDHTDRVTQLCFAPGQSLIMASSSTDGTIKFWDLADDGNMYKSFRVADYTESRGVKHKVKCIAWSPDAKRVVAVGTFKSVVLFDACEQKFLQRFNGHLNHVGSCDFSPDGVMLVTASLDTTAIVWNSYTGAILFRLGHQFPPPSEWFPGDDDTKVRSCRFLKDGLHVLTAADDGYVRVWSLTEPECPTMISTVEDALCFSLKSSGDLVAIGTKAGDVVMVSPPAEPQSLSHLCRLAANSSISQRHHQIDNLYLPTTIKHYLRYDLLRL